MSSFVYCLVGLLCLSAVSAHALRLSRPDKDETKVKIIIKTDMDKEKDNPQLASHRSCGLNQGTVCIPTACSNNSCSLFKDAVCVADRCGCEARFFNWMVKEKAFQDVSKMCFSTNAIMNFINFTVLANDTSAAVLKTEKTQTRDEKSVIAFFKEFNLLVTEILKDITDYIGIVAKADPTQENIDKLKSALRTLDSLKGASSRSSNIHSKEESDEIEKRINWKKVFSTGVKIAKHVAPLLLDEDVSINDAIEKRINWKNVFSTGLKIAKHVAPLLLDEDVSLDNASDEDTHVEDRINNTKISKADLNDAKLLFEDVDAAKNGTLKLSKIGEQFVADVVALEDVLSKNGKFADIVKSGNVAISDKSAQRIIKQVFDTIA